MIFWGHSSWPNDLFGTNVDGTLGSCWYSYSQYYNELTLIKVLIIFSGGTFLPFLSLFIFCSVLPSLIVCGVKNSL